MLNPGILDRMLDGLFGVVLPILAPSSPLVGIALFILGVMSTVYLVSMCVVAMAGMLDVIPQMGVALAKYMTFVWVITHGFTVSRRLIEMHASLGLFLSGGGMTAEEFRAPGRILWQGQDMLWPLINYINDMGWLDYALNFFQIQFMTVAMWVSWAGFAMFAGNIMFVQVQCWIAVLVNFLKLGFGIFSGTAFLAKEGLDSILSQCFRLATVSMLVGISTPWFKWLAFPPNEKPGYWSAFAFMMGVWTIVVLAFAGPRALQVHGAAFVSSAAGVAFGMVRGVGWLRR